MPLQLQWEPTPLFGSSVLKPQKYTATTFKASNGAVASKFKMRGAETITPCSTH